ncbi:MAG TPA: universal stress protein [Bacteroidota bacterium]
MKEFKKILVPTDYSELSLTAMDYAVSFSRMFGAQLFLLHTLDTIPVLALHAVDMTTETVIYETEKNAKSDLHDFVRSKFGDIPNLVEVVRKGIAEHEIVRYAQEENIDLIIMATHGRSGLAHVLMGSVAEKVIQHSPVPVLAVKPDYPARSLRAKNSFLGQSELA